MGSQESDMTDAFHFLGLFTRISHKEELSLISDAFALKRVSSGRATRGFLTSLSCLIINDRHAALSQTDQQDPMN